MVFWSELLSSVPCPIRSDDESKLLELSDVTRALTEDDDSTGMIVLTAVAFFVESLFF